MNPETRTDAMPVRALLRDLSSLLLNWSWEGVVGYEEEANTQLNGIAGRQ